MTFESLVLGERKNFFCFAAAVAWKPISYKNLNLIHFLLSVDHTLRFKKDEDQSFGHRQSISVDILQRRLSHKNIISPNLITASLLKTKGLVQ